MSDTPEPALTTGQNLCGRFGRGDTAGLLHLLSPEVEWQFIGGRSAPYTGTVRGHGGVGAWFGKVAQCDDILAFEPRQFLVGPDHVTVLGHERTCDRTTGREFESEWVHVMRVEGGKLTHFWRMLDSEAAAAARAARAMHGVAIPAPMR